MVASGLEVLARDTGPWLKLGDRVGLLLNSASVDAEWHSAREVLAGLPGVKLCALFGPQHGVRTDVQDNMVESAHAIDPVLRIPVWSLYAERRAPTAAMLEGLDVLVVDLQDVGCRVYTFIWTLRLVLEACGRAGVRVLVLDRPNPLGGAVEGNRLKPAWRSFVGLEPIPMRHGLTVGELARWFVGARGIACDLGVVPLAGWRPELLWPDTGRPWVLPSPNMPTFDTALVYPGMVLLEGSTASEGRGTTRPFELIGGPWLDSDRFAAILNAQQLPGVWFRPAPFLPTFQKWAGVPCGGVQLHVTHRHLFRPYRTGLVLLRELWRLHQSDGFAWRQPPYEYEAEKPPIHLLLGDDRLRAAIEAGAGLAELESLWAGEEQAWVEECAAYRLYGEGSPVAGPP